MTEQGREARPTRKNSFRNTLVGRGRDAIKMIFDADSFEENIFDDFQFEPDFGPGAVVGTARLKGQKLAVIANDGFAKNVRFKRVYAGIIGLEEAYKMAMTVYKVMECDQNKPVEQKRAIVLLVDTPGNAPGKVEEIIGMNKATGAYQLALAEARKAGHPILTFVIGRAISGGFLCHGLQGDRIISLSPEFKTMIHVMPLTSISRITKIDIERLEQLAKDNPVFAAGVDYFFRLGGIDEIVNRLEDMGEKVFQHIEEIRRQKVSDCPEKLGPWGRGRLAYERGGRLTRHQVLEKMEEQYEQIIDKFLSR